MKKKWTMLLTAPIILIGIMAMGVFPPTALAAITGVTPSGAASGDFIGLDVDVEGSYGVAGAPGADSSGRVYVYKIGTSGTFDQYAEENHSAPASGGDRFGESVAISGDLFIAGAPGYDKAFSGASVVTVGDAGAAFIFRRDASGLWNPLVSPHPYLLGTDGLYADSDGFGKAVDILYTGSGTDYAIVGAPNDAAVATTSGSVYFHSITGTTWAADGQKVYPGDAHSGTPADGGMNHYFGGSVSLSKGADGKLYAFVGAIGANSAKGAVYVYRRDATLGWQYLQTITVADGVSNDQFGFSVSASGSRLLVGTPKRDESGATNCGKTYAYLLGATNFAADGTILAKKFDVSNAIVDDVSTYALFGVDVDVSGDFAIIGAKDYGTSGAFYVYQRTAAATWTLKQRVAPTSPANADFGGSVSIYASGTTTYTTFVGAPEVGAGDVYTGDQTGGTITYNHFPTISAIDEQFVTIDETTFDLDFVVLDAETAASSLVVTASRVNVTGNIINDADGILTEYLTTTSTGRRLSLPLTTDNTRGETRISLTVKDAAGAAVTTTFTLTRHSPPVITGLIDSYITAKNVPYDVTFSATDAQTATSALVIGATASSGLVTISVSRDPMKLTITPATNGTGITTVTLTVTDTDGDFATASFSFIVNGGPELTVTPPSTLPVLEETTTDPFVVSVRDDESGILTLTASIAYPGETAPGTQFVEQSVTVSANATATTSFTVTPKQDFFGDAKITVTVTDHYGKSTSKEVTLSVTQNPNDDPPRFDVLRFNPDTSAYETLLPGKTLTIDEDSATELLQLKVWHPDAPGTGTRATTLTIKSNNTSIIPDNTTMEGYILIEGTPIISNTYSVQASSTPREFDLQIIPKTNASGPVDILLSITDGTQGDNGSFTLNILPKNDPPTISGITNQTVLEDSATTTMNFTVSDAETVATSLTVETVYADTNGLLSNLTLGGSGSNRTLSFTPAPNANSTTNGTLSVTIRVTDTGINGTDILVSEKSFVITVTSVNDPPEIEDILYLGNSLLDGGTLETVEINEDAIASVEVKISDPDNAVGFLEMTASGNGSSMLSGSGALVASGYGDTRILTLTPPANTSGEARVTVTVEDPDESSASADFILKVNAANDPPTISDLTDQTVLEDSGAKVVSFTVADAETLASNLTVEAIYSDTNGLIANLTLGGTGEERTLSFTPTANANSNSHGTLTVTVKVTDGGIGGIGPLFTEDSFVITVTSVNDPPKIKRIIHGATVLYDPATISTIQTLTIPEDTAVTGIQVEIEDPDQENPVHTLTLTGTSGLISVIANTGIVATGYTATRDLSLSPVANASGASLITLTVTDPASGSGSASFILSVTPVNDAPIISPVTDMTIDEDTTAGPITVTVTDPEGGALTLRARSLNTSLVANTISGTYVFEQTKTVSPGVPATFSLSLAPIANAFGTCDIELTATDSAPLAGDPVTFKLTVTNVNDPPAVSGIKAIYTINENQTLVIPQLPDVLTACDSDASYLIVSIAASTTEIFPEENLYIRYDQNGDGTITADEEYPNIYVLGELNSAGCQLSEMGLKLIPAQYQNGGPTHFTLTVKDEKGVTTTGEFDVQVYPVNNPPEISGTPEAYAYVGQAYTFTPTASDPDGTTVTFSAYIGTSTVVPGSAGWPTWLSFNAVTGTLSGTPLDADQGLITGIVISAKDASGLSASLPAFDIQVSKDKKAPVISDVTIPTTPKEDTPFTVTFDLSDGNGDVVTLTVASDTPGLIAENKIAFSGTGVSTVGGVVTVKTSAGGSPTLVTMTVSPEPDVSGNAQLTLTATDAPDAMMDTEVISLSVAAQADAPFITGIPLNYTLTLDEDAIDVVAGIVFPDDDANPNDGIFVGDPDGGILTISAESSNDALVADANVKIYAHGSSPGFGDEYMVSVPADGTGVHMTLRIYPTANAVGQTIITIRATDGTTETTSEFLLAISNDNDPPEIVSITVPITAMQEEGTLSVPFQVRDYDSGEVLTFTASGAPDLALFSQISFEGTGVNTNWNGSTYVYTLIPVAGTSYTVNLKLVGATDKTGTRNITITVTDKDAQTDTSTFPVTIAAVNDPPTIDSIANQTIDEDAETKVAFGIHDPDKELLEISVTTTTATLIDASSFRILVGAAETSYTSPYTAVYLNDTDEYGILKVLFKPVRDAFGTGSITVTVKDQAAVTATRTFSVTITPAQDPPSIAAIDNQTVPEDGTKAVTVTLTEPDGGTVTLYVKADNVAYAEEVVPNDKSNLAVTAGTGIITSIVNDDVNDRVVVTLTTQPNVAVPLTLTLKPVPDHFTLSGSPIPITLTADDGAHSVSEAFDLGVSPVNDAPAISTIVGPKITTAATPTAPITFKIADGYDETPVDSLVVDVTSSDTNVVPTNTTNLKVTTIPGDHNRQLVITPAGIVGETTITVKVIDTEGLSASTSFLLRVESGGTRIPVIGEISTPQLMQEGGTLSVDFTVNFPLNMGELVTNVLSVQGSSSKTSLVPNGSPYIVITYQSSSGDTHNYRMTITPPENVPTQTQETTTITVYAIAENYTQSRAFELKVDPINDIPVLTVPSSITTYENVAATLQFQIREYDGDKVTIYATSNKTTIIPNTSIKINTSLAPVQVTPQPDTASVLTLVATPEPSRTGDVVITLTADDGIHAPAPFAQVTIHILSSGTPRISLSGLSTCPPDQVTTRNTPIYLFLDVADLDGGLLTLGKSSDAPSVVATTGIVYSKNGAAISNILVEDAGGAPITQEVLLTVSPVSNAYGAARVTLTATDSSAKVGTCDFLVTIREIQPGDVNGNGVVDLTDAVLALKVMAGISVSGITYKADVNDDLRIGMEEVVYILRYVAGL